MKPQWKPEVKKRLALWVVVPILLTLPIPLLAINIVPAIFCQAPSANSKRAKFDVIVVLGNPANSDGSPSEVMQQRVLKAVELFRAGEARHILFTGAAVYNQFVEADVMAHLASSLGIPEKALLKDSKARNTRQNLFNATEIMQKNRWSSALVVTSPSHVKRTALILSHYNIGYRVVSSSVRPKLWIWEFLVGQWENYLLTRIAFSGCSKSYGLTQEQGEGVKKR